MDVAEKGLVFGETRKEREFRCSCRMLNSLSPQVIVLAMGNNIFLAPFLPE